MESIPENLETLLRALANDAFEEDKKSKRVRHTRTVAGYARSTTLKCGVWHEPTVQPTGKSPQPRSKG
jgi:hypothetical protein